MGNKRPSLRASYAVQLSLHFLPFISRPINHSCARLFSPLFGPFIRLPPSFASPLACLYPHNKVLGKLHPPTHSSSTLSPSVNILYAFGWSPVNKLRRGCARGPTRSTMVLPKPCRRPPTCYRRVAKMLLRACRPKAQNYPAKVSPHSLPQGELLLRD